MVTGYNTDVEHEGKIYHVQTEDKGLDNPVIETLIYCGGEILAARRSSYADLVEQGVDEETIAERIETQHKQLIADVRGGSYAPKKPAPFGEGIISSSTFDEVVLHYLRSLGGEDPIELELSATEPIVAGSTLELDLQVRRAASGQAVAGATIKAKVISTVGKPRIVGQGTTGDDGRVRMSCSLPALSRGSAVLIIQAAAGRDSAEIKQAIQKPIRQAAG